MQFSTTEHVKKRLASMARLTPEEMEGALPHVQFLPSDALHRYFAELLFVLAGDLESLRTALGENRDAIKRFDESSRRLTRWLIGLTVVLVILTIVIAWFTVLLWKGH